MGTPINLASLSSYTEKDEKVAMVSMPNLALWIVGF